MSSKLSPLHISPLLHSCTFKGMRTEWRSDGFYYPSTGRRKPSGDVNVGSDSGSGTSAALLPLSRGFHLRRVHGSHLLSHSVDLFDNTPHLSRRSPYLQSLACAARFAHEHFGRSFFASTRVDGSIDRRQRLLYKLLRTRMGQRVAIHGYGVQHGWESRSTTRRFGQTNVNGCGH